MVSFILEETGFPWPALRQLAWYLDPRSWRSTDFKSTCRLFLLGSFNAVLYLLAAQSWLILSSSTDCSSPGSSVHGILQGRILEWTAIPFSRGIFPTQGSNLSLLHCGQILYCLSHQGSPEPDAKGIQIKTLCLHSHAILSLLGEAGLSSTRVCLACASHWILGSFICRRYFISRKSNFKTKSLSQVTSGPSSWLWKWKPGC